MHLIQRISPACDIPPIALGEVLLTRDAPADGGRNPKWNEKLYFPLNGGEERIVVEIKDAVQSARPLGVASILLDKVRRWQAPRNLSLHQETPWRRESTSAGGQVFGCLARLPCSAGQARGRGLCAGAADDSGEQVAGRGHLPAEAAAARHAAAGSR